MLLVDMVDPSSHVLWHPLARPLRHLVSTARTPCLDVYEKGGQVWIKAALPGLTKIVVPGTRLSTVPPGRATVRRPLGTATLYVHGGSLSAGGSHGAA